MLLLRIREALHFGIHHQPTAAVNSAVAPHMWTESSSGLPASLKCTPLHICIDTYQYLSLCRQASQQASKPASQQVRQQGSRVAGQQIKEAIWVASKLGRQQVCQQRTRQSSLYAKQQADSDLAKRGLDVGLAWHGTAKVRRGAICSTWPILLPAVGGGHGRPKPTAMKPSAERSTECSLAAQEASAGQQGL